jgi:hypothetical protein
MLLRRPLNTSAPLRMLQESNELSGFEPYGMSYGMRPSARSRHEDDEELCQSYAAARHHAGAAPPPATSPTPPSFDAVSPALLSTASLGRHPTSRTRPHALRAAPPTPDLDRLLAPPPASASPPAAPPGLALPRLNCIGGEKRGRGRQKGREERSCVKRKKEEEKKERRKEKKREKINYLFVENMISKLYCLLLFGKENKK